MKFSLIPLLLGACCHAARPFINEYNTGLTDFLGPDFPKGKLPELKDIWTLYDFDWSARNFLNSTAYTWIRHAVSAEHTYRNNLEIWAKVGLKPRMLTGDSHVEESMKTTILGHNFSAPFFISPAAAPGLVGGYVPKHREQGLLDGAYNEGILYIPAMYAEMSVAEMAKIRGNRKQAIFQQFYADKNDTTNKIYLQAAEQAGAKAIVWTVDAPIDGPRIRSERWTMPASTTLKTGSWSDYAKYRTMTTLPIIPKGILSVADARKAVSLGAPAIIISNHGGRHVDTVPSALQIALAIRDEAPEIFEQTEVLADGGVRYGTDVLKMLALGVKAVGLGRTPMYANLYGTEGVEKMAQLMKKEILLDAVNLGVKSLDELDTSYGAYDYLRRNEWD